MTRATVRLGVVVHTCTGSTWGDCSRYWHMLTTISARRQDSTLVVATTPLPLDTGATPLTASHLPADLDASSDAAAAEAVLPSGVADAETSPPATVEANFIVIHCANDDLSPSYIPIIMRAVMMPCHAASVATSLYIYACI